jgi:hypothetical protein
MICTFGRLMRRRRRRSKRITAGIAARDQVYGSKVPAPVKNEIAAKQLEIALQAKQQVSGWFIKLQA